MIWCIGVHIACMTSGGKLSKRIMVGWLVYDSDVLLVSLSEYCEDEDELVLVRNGGVEPGMFYSGQKRGPAEENEMAEVSLESGICGEGGSKRGCR